MRPSVREDLAQLAGALKVRARCYALRVKWVDAVDGQLEATRAKLAQVTGERDAERARYDHWRRELARELGIPGWITDSDVLRRLVAMREQREETLDGALDAMARRVTELGDEVAGVTASRERLLAQSEQFEADLMAVDEVLAKAGATPATDRVEAVRELARWGEVDRDTAKSLARRVAWLEGDRGPIDPTTSVRERRTDPDDPCELRALAGEMHRWAPDIDALKVRDRLLDLARHLDEMKPTPRCGWRTRDIETGGDWHCQRLPGHGGNHVAAAMGLPEPRFASWSFGHSDCRPPARADDPVLSEGDHDVLDRGVPRPAGLSPICVLVAPDGVCAADLDGATCVLPTGHDEPCWAGPPIARCGARDAPDAGHGPCHQVAGHGGRHQDALGYEWATGHRGAQHGSRGSRTSVLGPGELRDHAASCTLPAAHLGCCEEVPF